MSAAPVWRVVAGREIGTRIKQKSFLISAVLMVAGVVGLVVLASVLADKPAKFEVATTTPQAQAVVDHASAVLSSSDEGAQIKVMRASSESSAKKLVTSGRVDAALLPTEAGYRIVGDRDIDPTLDATLTTAVQTAALKLNAEAQSVYLNALQFGADVQTELLDPTADNADARSALAFIMVLIFYMTALMFGMPIAQSVVQEKESRIIEILAAAVPIRALLWGKVIGNSILALLQVGIVVVSGLVALKITDVGQLSNVAVSSLGWFVVFYLLGFLAMAGVWAIAGSLASRQEDLQSTTMPANLLLIAPYFISVLASESVKTTFSMLPISSAMVMPARLAEGDVPAWQLAVAVAANLLAIVVTIRLAAAVYERTLMRTEKKLSLRDALTVTD